MSDEIERTNPFPSGEPPKNLDAEKAVIGAIISDNREIAEVVSVLRADHFFDTRHRDLFAGVVSLWNDGEAVDFITLADKLRTRGVSADAMAIGGMVAKWHETTTYSSQRKALPHAKLIERAAHRRAIFDAGRLISRNATECATEDDATEDSQRAVLALAGREVSNSAVSGGDVARGTVATLRKLVAAGHGGGVTGLETGYPQIDAITSGLQAGDLTVIAGRPAMGKTSLALCVAMHAASQRRAVLFFSVEMSRAQLGLRMLALRTGIGVQQMRTANLVESHWAVLEAATTTIASEALCVDDGGEPSITDIRSKARLAALRARVDLILVDYIQIVRAQGKNREQEVSEVSRGLKALAKEVGCPVIALAQLNRGLEARQDKRPLLSDLRESGAIEQDADLVAFVYRDEYYHPKTKDPGIAEVIIAKQRNGPTGTVRLGFHAGTTAFFPLNRGPKQQELPMSGVQGGWTRRRVAAEVEAVLEGLAGMALPALMAALRERGMPEAPQDATKLRKLVQELRHPLEDGDFVRTETREREPGEEG